MKRMKLALKAATVVIGTVLVMSGCAQTEKTAKNGQTESVTLPITEDITLNIWARNTHNVVDNMKDMGCYQVITDNTNIKLNFISPVANQQQEQFNIMIASGEYPDIIEQLPDYYPGGFVKAHQDGVIMELSDLIDKYAPNLNALFETYPQVRDESMDENGNLFAIPMIRGGNIVRTYTGPIVRADYLQKFGLDIPTTIDDWHNMLTIFKNNGITYPLTATRNYFYSQAVFQGAFGVNAVFYMDNGKIHYGPYEEGWKEYVKTMAQWYKEGLLDSEIMSNDQSIADSKIKTQGAGAFVGTCGNSIGGYMQDMQSSNPEFDLVAVPYPVLNEGETNRFVQRDSIAQPRNGSSITTTCEHPEIAMAFLDYGFSKEGHLALNFGVEGESYEMVDGSPKYTEIVTNNPEGFSVSKAGSLYARAFTFGTMVQDVKYGEQFYGMPRQLEAGSVWTQGLEEIQKNNPRVLGDITLEQSDETTSMQNEINTYTSEMFVRWIMGRENIDETWDAYKHQLQQMGIETILQYKQEAYDRYLQKYPDMKQPGEFEVSDYYWN